MNIKKSLKSLVTLAIAGSFSTGALAAPSNAEIFDMMQEMKKELQNLKAENNALKGTVEDVAISTDEAIKAQKILGILHLLGGILLFVAASAESFNLFYPYIFIGLSMIFYAIPQ